MNVLTSILTRAFIAGTPLLLATLGEIYVERSGVINLGIEGMMAIGAIVSFATTYTTKNLWLGLIAGIITAGGVSLIHAFVSITIHGRQILSGLAITMLGLGLSGLLGKSYIGVPLPVRFTSIKIPILSKIPIIGDAIFSQDILFYSSVILSIVMWFLLFKTKWGINLRSVGENPLASEAMGVNVTKVRYISVFIGGCLAGMAGAHLTLLYTGSWIEGMIGGRGWIVIALTIFALWNPLRAILGSFLFGGVYVLQYVLQARHISPNILLMFPYITTLLVLLITSGETMRKRIGAPSALGEPFIKGEK